jgi:outer membrane protein TolC
MIFFSFNPSPYSQMKQKLSMRLLAVLAILYAGQAAFSDPHPEMLSWNDCVKIAAEKNPDVAVAVAALKSADALYGASYSNFFPQLSATGSYTASSQGVTNSASAGNNTLVTGTSAAPSDNAIQNNYSAGLSLTQSVFNGFADMGKVRQGRANLEAAKAAVQIAKFTLSSNLKTAFANLLYQQQSIALSLKILKHEEENLHLVNLRFEGGQENRGNQLYEEATVAQDLYQYEHAQRSLRIAVLQLAAYMGTPDRDDLVVKGELIAHDPPSNPDLRKLAVINANHVQAFQQAVAADANVAIQQGNYYPNVSLTGFLGNFGSAFPPDTTRWSAGVSITFPFFPGTSTIYGVQNAVALRGQADYNTTSTDNKLIAALESGWDGLRDAIAQMKVGQQFAEAARARSVIATEKYNTGLMDFEDWSVIEIDLATREQNLLQYQLNAMQAEATWELAVGKGDVP